MMKTKTKEKRKQNKIDFVVNIYSMVESCLGQFENRG